MKTIRLDAKTDVTFDEAQSLAREEAARHFSEPMELAWLNRETGRHCPDVDCCQAERKESWEIYAENRGGSLRVEIGERFIFIFREGAVQL